MKITILTLFPEMFIGVFDHSIIKLAQEKNVIDISFVNIRDFGIGKHKIIDDKPYGGGVGMVMRVDVIVNAITSAKCKMQNAKCKERVILLDPGGQTFTQKKAKSLTEFDHIILICGRYEGVDNRIRLFIDEEISIGDYVLTGGEIPAMVILDSVSRLLPNVLGKDESSQKESFQEVINQKEKTTQQLLEYPQFTRPEEYKSMRVPEILLSGDHQKIAEWRLEQAIKKTKQKRPDLLKGERKMRNGPNY